MSDDSLPLLRSPPFPGVKARVAAVSCGSAEVTPAPTDAQATALLAAVGEARVGGAFWAEPERTAMGIIVRARARDNLKRLAQETTAPALWVTDRRFGRRVPSRHRSIGGAVDPWSLLSPGRTLVAHGADEWVAIAAIAGADVRLLSSGRFGHLDDDGPTRRRRIAGHLLATMYRNPFTGAAASLDDTLALLALWRSLIGSNRSIVAAAGMAWWKRAEIRRLLWAPRRYSLQFRSGAAAIGRAASRGGDVAVWPSRVSARTLATARRREVALVQVEDGFVRSVGLGVDLVPPLSVVVDRLGIHYDPSRPSDLEQMIATVEPTPALLSRAAALRSVIVAQGIGKYGGAPDTVLPTREAGRRLVLVPGQVEDDRSVLLGGGAVTGNLDLLRRVRAAEPGAEIWYRPHPDVDAGHRRGGVRDQDALRHVDRVVRGGGMAALLDRVDAVHVLTSLTGFEALLRRLEVTCHGTPFYAGWGLTHDLGRVPARRGRRVTLDGLVAVALILYPRYLDPATALPCTAEVLIDRLADRAGPPDGWLVRWRKWQGRLARTLR